MSLKDLIAAAFNKDATAFESAFSSVMKEKVASAIDSRFLAREELELDEAKDEEDEDEEDDDSEDEDEDKGLKEAYSAGEASKYHRDMEAHHDAWSRAHDHEANNVGPRTQEKHSYAETHHANAENYHKKAREVLKTHGVDSPEYKKARSKANNASDIANESTSETPKKWKTAGKPTHQTPTIKEGVEELDEISGAKLGTYMIKARKSEAELDKKRDDSYDKPNTPENKAERKAISRTLNKRRWGQGKALDKLTGSSFGKVPATEK